MSNHSSVSIQTGFNIKLPVKKKSFLSSSTTLAMIGSTFVTAPLASATPPNQCLADEFSPGQYLVTATADCELSIPGGVTTLEALLVGAGGTSISGYAAGGGGEETVTTTMSKDVTTWTIQVGRNNAGDGNSGRDSLLTSGVETFTARGGRDGDPAGGQSGSENGGSLTRSGGAGGGAGGPAASGSFNGGSGIHVSSFTQTEYLKTMGRCFGGGGATAGAATGGADFINLGVADCGGGYYSFQDVTPAPETVTISSFASLTPILEEARPNSGGGGGQHDGYAGGSPENGQGADGVVYVYYRIPRPIPVSIPDPIQTSSVGSCIATAAPISGRSSLAISGTFTSQIRNIEVAGTMLPQSSWVQSGTSVAISLAPTPVGIVPITLYNGQIPLLAATCDTTPKPVTPPADSTPPKEEPVPAVTPPQETATVVAPPKEEQPTSVTLKLKVFFKLSSRTIYLAEKIKLESLATEIAALGGKVSITVTGYAQPTPGTEKTDGALSRARASAVASFLKKSGVDGPLTFSGAGRAKVNVPASRYVEIVAIHK